MNSIVAVAIAGNDQDFPIKSSGDLRDLRRVRVRPYLRGLVQGLDARNYTLGTDYNIIFRQRIATSLNAGTFANPNPANARLIFCMSTTVVGAAANVFPQATGQPIVGIVSAPGPAPNGEGFDTTTNICGVSAKRSQTADKCFNHFFRTVPTLTEVKVLHNPTYGPSVRALAQVRQAAGTKVPPVLVTPLNITSVADIQMRLDALAVRDPNTPATVGIQVLPVDVCLGYAQDIIDLAQGEKKLPTFFPVPDWVKSDGSGALGAYGVPQHSCGVLMAERVDAIWAAGGVVPAIRWVDAPPDAFEFLASAAAAEALNIKLHGSIPRA